jgi:hypothetical protein
MSLYWLYVTLTFGAQLKPRAVFAISAASAKNAGWLGIIAGALVSWVLD